MIYRAEQKYDEQLGRSIEIVADERGLKDIIEACLGAIGCAGSSHPGYCVNINVKNTGTPIYVTPAEQHGRKFSNWPKE